MSGSPRTNAHNRIQVVQPARARLGLVLLGQNSVARMRTFARKKGLMDDSSGEHICLESLVTCGSDCLTPRRQEIYRELKRRLLSPEGRLVLKYELIAFLSVVLHLAREDIARAEF